MTSRQTITPNMIKEYMGRTQAEKWLVKALSTVYDPDDLGKLIREEVIGRIRRCDPLDFFLPVHMSQFEEWADPNCGTSALPKYELDETFIRLQQELAPHSSRLEREIRDACGLFLGQVTVSYGVEESSGPYHGPTMAHINIRVVLTPGK